MRSPLLSLAAALLLAFPAFAAEPESPIQSPIALEFGIQVPMRDGVHLNATIYHPARQTEQLPVVAILTPYIADSGHDRAVALARHGYTVALVDVRGRGNSGGTFEPLAHEAQDGYDLVEWLARQPWCNGKVAMRGGSYAGAVQWAALKEKPPHLVTIVPTASPYPGVDFPFYKNIFFPYLYQWLTLTSGAANNSKLFADRELWNEKLGELYRLHRPYRELADVVGNRTTVFRKWLQHPTPDSYWNPMAPTPEQYAVIDAPILTITGAYDGDQPGALAYYRRHLRWASRSARDKHFLVIGPWDHLGTATPALETGGLTFGEASRVDMEKLHRDWFDWTLKGGPQPEFLKKRVAYYVTGPGAETWKYADTLEAVERERRTLYLSSRGGRANDVFASGRLSPEPPQPSPPDRYTYDPLDIRPAERESEASDNPFTDQRFVFDLNGAGLVYHTAPFPEATEIAGQVKLSLWMSLDVPDTDFLVGLFEIRPDGSSVLLGSDMLRARYRESLETAKLVEPSVGSNKVERYDFDSFAWFARRVAKGSRLRLVVTSPNSLFFEKNYNAGGVVAAESGREARTAHVTLWHDAEHPSALEIPIGR
jgi:putative CocE/NonD family hydrolase